MSESTIKINAIVVKIKDSGENGRIFTLLSPQMGKLSVMANGIKSLRHKSRSACFPLSYSSFVLKKIKDGLYSLVSADLIESFHALSGDVLLLSYGTYFADLCRMCVQNAVESEEEVRLLLNTLYMLCKRNDAAPLIKAVFEIKIAELCGILPDFSYECPCGEEGMYFCSEDGEIRCSAHKTPSSHPVTKEEIKILQYISQSSLKDALFFNCDMNVAHSLSYVTEPFLLYHLTSLPDSLDYLKKITKKL